MPGKRAAPIWRATAASLLVLLVVSYVWGQQKWGYMHGGSPIGLLYGTLALLLIGYLLWFGVRKRSYRSRLGTLESWLQAHIYLGAFCFFLVVAHTGFRFEDRVATALMIVFALVVISGVVGAVLYRTVPRRLTAVDANLAPDALSDEMNQITRSMARIASNKSEPFQKIYLTLVREAVPQPLAGWRLVLGGGGKKEVTRRTDDWTPMTRLVAEDEQEQLRQMLVLSRQQKELHLRLVAQRRYRNLLEAWLWIHLPLSIVMIVLIVAHLWGVLLYAELPL